MSIEKNLEKFKQYIRPDSIDDSLARFILEDAGEIVLNTLYPTRRPANAEVPERYDSLQVQIAMEIFSKRGAEGENSHSENGISRHYESSWISPTLLHQIVPYVSIIE